MAQACVNSLQAYGLGTDGIIYGGKRMGLYFLESGAAFRNSNVVYVKALPLPLYVPA